MGGWSAPAHSNTVSGHRQFETHPANHAMRSMVPRDAYTSTAS